MHIVLTMALTRHTIQRFHLALCITLTCGLASCTSTPSLPDQSTRVQLLPGAQCRANAPLPGTFERLTTDNGLSFSHDAFPVPEPGETYIVEDLAGSAMADLNDDGWLDLIFANGAGDLHIFWNRETTFEETVPSNRGG